MELWYPKLANFYKDIFARGKELAAGNIFAFQL